MAWLGKRGPYCTRVTGEARWLRRALLALMLSTSAPCAAQTALPSTPMEVSAAPAGRGSTLDGNGEEASRRAFDEGLTLLRQERWHEAELAFRRSLIAEERTSALYDLALVLFEQGRSRECLRTLDTVFARASASADAKYLAYARELSTRATASLSRVRFELTPAVALLTVDGDFVPVTGGLRVVTVDAGVHHVELRAPGFEPVRFDLITGAGTVLERRVTLEPIAARPSSPPPAKSSSRALPWIVAATGGALVLAGLSAGVLARAADDEFTSRCPSLQNCDPGLRATQSRAASYGHLADGLLIGGGLLALGGVSWTIFAPARPAAAQALGLSFAGTF